MLSRPAVNAWESVLVRSQTIQDIPVKVFDLLQQADRFGGLPYTIFLALQRALT